MQHAIPIDHIVPAGSWWDSKWYHTIETLSEVYTAAVGRNQCYRAIYCLHLQCLTWEKWQITQRWGEASHETCKWTRVGKCMEVGRQGPALCSSPLFLVTHTHIKGGIPLQNLPHQHWRERQCIHPKRGCPLTTQQYGVNSEHHSMNLALIECLMIYCKADHSFPASAGVKKTWIYTSTPPYAFIS
jgi:hypothetical protein